MMNLRISASFWLTLVALACGGPPLFQQQTDDAEDPLYVAAGGGSDAATKDVKVLAPEGLLSEGESLAIEEGDEIFSDSFSSSLNINGSATTISSSINISGNVDESKISSMQLEIPLESSSALVGSYDDSLAVIYHVKKADGTYLYGLIPFVKLSILESKVRFFMVGLGNYQAVILSEPVSVERSETTTNESKTKKESEPVPTNAAPIIANVADRQHSLSTDLTLSLDASDPDGDSLSFSCLSCPSGMQVSPAGVLSWSNNLMSSGSYAVTIKVSDGNKSATTSFSLTITAPSVPTANLLVYFDAAKASTGAYPGTGCGVTTWEDLSGNAYDSVLTSFAACGSNEGWNGTGSVTDPYRLEFNASDLVYTKIVDEVPFDLTSAVTLVAIVRPNSTSNMSIAGKGYHNGSHFGGPYYLITYGGKFALILNTMNPTVLASAPGATSTTNVAANQWQFVAASYSSGTLKYYVNGVLDSEHSITNNSLAQTSDTFKMGQAGLAANAMDGAISTVVLYSSVLSAAEVQQICYAYTSSFSDFSCD